MPLFVPRTTGSAAVLASGTGTTAKWVYDNWGSNPAATPGVAVIANTTTTNSEGAWVQLASSAQINADVFAIELFVHTSNSTGNRQHILDIGVDPAGGTSYTAIINNINCGNLPAVTATTSGQSFLFPYYIKSGSSVAVRMSASVTAYQCFCAARFYGHGFMPEGFPIGQYSETIGTVASSSGQSFTPGNAADGTWTSLGTTSQDLFWWQLCFSISNATITAEYTYIDLGYGDGSNKHVMIRALHGGTTGETVGDMTRSNLNVFQCYHPVPGGSTIYVRGRCNNAPDTGYNAVAIGIG